MLISVLWMGSDIGSQEIHQIGFGFHIILDDLLMAETESFQ